MKSKFSNTALVATFILALAAVSAFSGQLPQPPKTQTDQISASAYSEVFAVSDIHGMYKHALTLLHAAKIIDSDNHWAAGNSLLVVVGDSIDKGPQSIEMLDLWIQLSAEASAARGKVIHLLGNHEAEFLADPTDDSKAAELIAELKSKGLTTKDMTDPSKPRGAFLLSMPLALKVGNWLFCHSGNYPDKSWSDFQSKAQSELAAGSYDKNFITGDDSILEAKGWWKKKSDRADMLARLDQYGFTGLVQGHQPSAYNITNRIGAIEDGRLVKIDSGMAPTAGSNTGEILHFPKASQLSGKSIPEMEVIHANGNRSSLTPEEFDKDKEIADDLD